MNELIELNRLLLQACSLLVTIVVVALFAVYWAALVWETLAQRRERMESLDSQDRERTACE